MGRVSSVWIAYDHRGTVRAVCSIRHELASWLRQCPDVDARWKVIKYDDYWCAQPPHRRDPVQPQTVVDVPSLLGGPVSV